MSSGIKKRTGSEYSDGRPGRINYHSEDEYRTVTLIVQSTAYDMQDVAHLRDSINELFDGELMLREMRIKSAEVEYESMGQRTGEMQLEAPEYVNGKQIKGAVVNSPEIDDTTLVSTFTVEFETTESPYFETIYTTLELHDSGYSATAEKYGLVDNIDDEKVQYRFTPQTDYMPNLISLTQAGWEVGSIASTTGGNTSLEGALRTKNYIPVTKGERYYFNDSSAYASAISKINILQYQDGVYLGTQSWHEVNRGGTLLFVPRGNQIKLSLVPMSGFNIHLSFVGHTDNRFRMKLELGERFTGYEPSDQTFVVYNAGNVAVEPESMYINILFWYCTIIDGKMTIKNLTTGDALEINRNDVRRHIRQEGINVTVGGVNRFRDTNKRFISLAPGDNRIEITGAIFDEARINFKFYYK